jgi:hypothetical protein
VGKGKRVDVYIEVRKRRGIYFFNETSACAWCTTVPLNVVRFLRLFWMCKTVSKQISISGWNINGMYRRNNIL